MKSLYDFIIKPIGSRYNNKKQIGDITLIVNTEIFNHQYINREAEVLNVPLLIDTEIQVGDSIIVHHNIFRRWHNIRGEEKNSRSYINENTYCAQLDQIYAYKRNNDWQALKEYCFVKPIQSNDKLSLDKEMPLVGIMYYANDALPNIKVGDLVGFTPDSEFEFIIDNNRLYRVLIKDIAIKYEYQGQEKEYNPSWL